MTWKFGSKCPLIWQTPVNTALHNYQDVLICYQAQTYFVYLICSHKQWYIMKTFCSLQLGMMLKVRKNMFQEICPRLILNPM